MAEKKGFFGRLFGRDKAPAEEREELSEEERIEAEEAEAREDEAPEAEALENESDKAEAGEKHRAEDELESEGVAALSQETDSSTPPHTGPEPGLDRPALATPPADEEAGTLPGGPAEETAEAEREDAPVTLTEEAEEPGPQPAAASPARQGWLQRLTSGLSKSSNSITSRITGSFTKRRLDDETLEELEDVLISADLGVETATAITERLARERYDRSVDEAEVRAILADEVARTLKPVAEPLNIDAAKKPFVILVVGVNGSGKTTTIGKLAAKLRAEGRAVMLAAGDTFRAAAIEQLKIWGERTGSEVIAREQGADAAGLAFDAMEAARNAGTDILIIDTAGRLQNRAELMAELEKVVRVIKKHDPEAPHATLLTLDATTGQNAMSQVEIFADKAGVSGLVMTKLDGTARGGILVAIAARHGLPVHFIGVGEGVDDLQPFKAEDFARAIAGF
ncbi:signal recognition particle-docking protein FtsY [Afifella pfennigii]|uniref:signal recognition particle-docking protein FtsY n=1 Tax=Afifella pfennigii TaxID=209897 RepID=UPI00047B08CB|nr:signal recognition particle-docking protein FtsY [Afifella pfennigii]